MDYRKEALKLARAFTKYRKLQVKLTTLRSKAPNPKNVQPVTDLLRQIDFHLKDMDTAAAAIINYKPEDQ